MCLPYEHLTTYYVMKGDTKRVFTLRWYQIFPIFNEIQFSSKITTCFCNLDTFITNESACTVNIFNGKYILVF